MFVAIYYCDRKIVENKDDPRPDLYTKEYDEWRKRNTKDVVCTIFMNTDNILSFSPMDGEKDLYYVNLKSGDLNLYYTDSSEVARACQFTEDDLKCAFEQK